MFDAETGEDLGVVGDGGDLQAVTDGYGALVVHDSASLEDGTTATLFAGRFSADYLPSNFRPIDLYTGVIGGGDTMGGVTIGNGLMLHAGTGVASSTPGATQLRTLCGPTDHGARRGRVRLLPLGSAGGGPAWARHRSTASRVARWRHNRNRVKSA